MIICWAGAIQFEAMWLKRSDVIRFNLFWIVSGWLFVICVDAVWFGFALFCIMWSELLCLAYVNWCKILCLCSCWFVCVWFKSFHNITWQHARPSQAHRPLPLQITPCLHSDLYCLIVTCSGLDIDIYLLYDWQLLVRAHCCELVATIVSAWFVPRC